MSKLFFYSTNKNVSGKDAEEAILAGIAEDRGLFMPEKIPALSPDEISAFSSLEYAAIAGIILNKFLDGVVPKAELDRICRSAYDFPVPIQQVEKRFSILWLDEGPTLAFKDFAARAMAGIMHYLLSRDKKRMCIITATSGDTGSAVGNAFHGMEGIDVIILYPKSGVTERQRKLMTTLGGNIICIAIDGSFDDCQALAKSAFTDKSQKSLNLGSANSINIARLIPQIVYYAYACSRVGKVNFSVPCGNFGNLMGGLFAKRMGIPIGKFIAAVNANDSFARFYDTSLYQKIFPSINCLSNAMNVGHPSNIARLIDLYGGQMDEQGTIKAVPDMEMLRKEIWAMSVTDEQTREEIRSIYERFGIVVEPHGAVALYAYEQYLKEQQETAHGVCLETADPSKFPEAIRETIGLDPAVPKAMQESFKKKEFVQVLGKDYRGFQKYLMRWSHEPAE